MFEVLKGQFLIRRATALAFLMLGLLLLSMDVGLLRETRLLRRAVQTANDGPGPLSAGRTIPIIRGTSPDGTAVTVGYHDVAAKTVLLLFSPGCEPCETTAKDWKELIGKSRGQYRFVALSAIPDIHSVEEFAARHRLSDILIIAKPDSSAREQYGLGFVPQTVVVNNDGVVEKVWPGALGTARRAELERYLGLGVESPGH